MPTGEKKLFSRFRTLIPFTKERLPETIAFILFTTLSIWMFIVHEPWADEAQAWLIASSFENPLGMLSVAGYEGSPMLWHFILWIFYNLGLEMWSMRVFHLFIAMGSAYLILWYAPFTANQRIMSIFGYYFVFEYNTIARSYGLTIFFLAYLGKYYNDRYNHKLRIGIILALLAQTNIHGLIFSLVIFGTMILERLIQDRDIREMIVQYYKLYIPFTIGVIFAIIVLLPPHDLPEFIADWSSIRSSKPIDYGQFFTMRGFFPIQTTQSHFWSYDLRVSIFSFTEAKNIATLILILIFFQFIKKGYPLLMLYSTVIGYNILFVYKRGICPRHCGLIFVIYFFTYWFSLYYDDINWQQVWNQAKNKLRLDKKPQEKEQEQPGRFLKTLSRIYHNDRLRSSIFTIFLIIQLISMPVPVYHDTSSDFSHSESVAQYLIDNNLISDEILIAAHSWFPTISIIPHLPEGHQKLYFIEQERYGTYVKWNDVFFDSISINGSVVAERGITKYVEGNFTKLIIILNYEMSDAEFLSKFAPMVFFENALVGEENFYIYTLI